jgi:hydroxylamine reductase (hybrid-cluster protein)
MLLYLHCCCSQELAKALNTDVNSLPLSLDISWFEQKAVAVLLTLLNLGVQNIRLGPNLPGEGGGVHHRWYKMHMNWW